VLDGHDVGEDVVVRPGQALMFTRPGGEKGQRGWYSTPFEEPSAVFSFGSWSKASLSPQRGEGRGEGCAHRMRRSPVLRRRGGLDFATIARAQRRSHPSPSIPLPVEGRGKLRSKSV
jgi:hypothetical protein